jgi:membrane fusion protein (multidrug efflux system)
MTQRHPTTATPDIDPSYHPEGARPRAPLVGVVSGVLMFAAFVGWSGVRIHAATLEKTSVAAQRNEDQKRANELAHVPQSVSVVTPTPATWDPVVEIDGTVAAGQHAELGFKTGGRIAQIAVKVGDSIKAGQLLATLDAGEASAQLRATQAQVRAAEAQLALASDSDRRTQTMVQSGSVAEGAGVQSTQQRALATAQLEAAQAQLALNQVALGNHRLIAPFSGSITRAPEGIGAVVSPGATLFEIDDLSRLKLKGTLGEQDAALVEPGAVLSIDTEHGAVTGTVTAVLGSVDPSTRRVRVEATIENAGGRLRAGSFVRASVQGKSSLSVLKLPHEALRPGSQDEVFVVENDALAARHLAFSVASDGTLLVRHGLGANERVVLAPRSDAEVGDRVTVAPVAPASAAPATGK